MYAPIRCAVRCASIRRNLLHRADAQSRQRPQGRIVLGQPVVRGVQTVGILIHLPIHGIETLQMVAESPGRFVLRFLIELGQLLDLRALSGIFAGDFRRGPDHFPFDVVGQMESDVLVGPIDQNEQAWLVGGEQLHGERSDRGIRPIRIMRRLSVRQEPVHAVGFLQQSDFAQSGEEILMVVEVPGLSQRYQPGSEVEQLELRGLLGAVQPIPIQPCGLIVLRVGVVVAVLRVAEFVAGKQHRRAQGEQQRAQHVHDGPFVAV